MIAHPARTRLYELLVVHGPRTVSQLAEETELAVGSASYHLRQLQRAGFVEDDTSQSADKRTHWWRAVPGGLRWSAADFIDSPSARALSTAAQRVLAQRRFDKWSDWNATWHEWGARWADAAIESDALLELTPDELSKMSEEISAVIRRWSHRSESSDAARTVFLFISAFPTVEAE
ncbi:MAG TPA: helix-turn-helix domain-containing protein [Nocardioidaceae bacterium]|nr:helix-turn-helix domain-containing protein [Nocardioidaceae bacterium]